MRAEPLPFTRPSYSGCASWWITISPATAIAPATIPEPSARVRKRRSRSSSPSRRASALRYTAAKYAPEATARSPTKIEVGLSQLETRSPAAFPTGTRREAMPPTAAPSANGVSTDEIPNSVSIVRCSCPADAPARSAYAAPRKMIPTAAMKSAKLRVDAIEPNAAGYAVQTTVSTKIEPDVVGLPDGRPSTRVRGRGFARRHARGPP